MGKYLETTETYILRKGVSGGKEEGQTRCFNGLHLVVRCGVAATPAGRATTTDNGAHTPRSRFLPKRVQHDVTSPMVCETKLKVLGSSFEFSIITHKNKEDKTKQYLLRQTGGWMLGLVVSAKRKISGNFFGNSLFLLLDSQHLYKSSIIWTHAFHHQSFLTHCHNRK